MNAAVGVQIARGKWRARILQRLSYASINWIRFKGSPSRAVSRRPLASQPPAGAPLARAKVVRARRQVNLATLCLAIITASATPAARDLHRRGM